MLPKARLQIILKLPLGFFLQENIIVLPDVRIHRREIHFPRIQFMQSANSAHPSHVEVVNSNAADGSSWLLLKLIEYVPVA